MQTQTSATRVPTPRTGAFPERRHVFLLLAGLALFLGAGLGSRGLNEPDEGRYATIALSMLHPGADMWEPRFSGYAHYDKPPLVYWAAALSFAVFGRTEFAARLPSYAAALLALAAVGWAAWRLRGPEKAWWTVLICGTLLQFAVLARFLTPDMLLTACCTLGVAAWAETRHRGGSWPFWCLSLLFWSLGWWTKPAAAAVPLVGLAVGLWVAGDTRGLRALRPVRLVAGVLVLGAPWFVRMMVEHPETVDFFLRREVVGRIAGHVDGREGPVFYYALLSVALWAPWLPVLATAALVKRRTVVTAATWRERLRALGVEGHVVLTGLLVFSLLSSKLPGYTLPLAPWAAMFLARLLLKIREAVEPRSFRRLVVGCAGSAVVIMGAAAAVVPAIESSMGANASVRLLSRRLQALGAEAVYVDRHFSGLEFYFGERVTYVRERPPRQRQTDDGLCRGCGRSHFVKPSDWAREASAASELNAWVVHDRQVSRSPLLAAYQGTPPAGAESLGQFVFWKVR